MTKAIPSADPKTRLSVTAHPQDNVATLLDGKVDCAAISGGLTITKGVPFGHKVALRSISVGEAIVKYGVVIGHAYKAIGAGEHVHVHNIR
ncbi:UxaA family hydrolase [Ruegeria arenilitoris]|uniref:UxaA family hydrolase n=1 Tax=Ruegeria arenilitoris TaxID=1173585 RepID=UPI00147BA501|nr:UxaA family hydrolase [Ruegeria arenilitoris]